MLDVNGLEASYDQSQILFGVSLSIAEGEVVTLLGRNGMGKTTTVSTVMGIVAPWLTMKTKGAVADTAGASRLTWRRP